MSEHVLIIDDEWTIQRALCARLSAAGFILRSASHGEAGLRAAREERPDAILLDLRMPDMDGFEVFRRLRADPALATVPVIFLTANVQDTARQEARTLGAAGFLCKPYDPKQVIHSLRSAIAGNQALATQGALT
ncbi:MAG: response regulator [Phycisphaerales bacterium]